MEGLLEQACELLDVDHSGFLSIQNLSSALRNADLGLSKFQITMLCADAEQGGQGVDYRQFISQSASHAILHLVDMEEQLQSKRARAWEQVTAEEQRQGESVDTLLGLTQEDFSRMINDLFQEADEDKNGFLTQQIFEDCIRSSGVDLSRKEVKMLISAAEVNKDGLLEYTNFAPVAFNLIKQIMRESKINGKMNKKLVTRAHYHMVAADAPEQHGIEEMEAQHEVERQRLRKEKREAAAKRREQLMRATS